MAIVDSVREVVAPLVSAVDAQLYDVEHHGAVVRVLVDAEGGIDLETIAQLSRSVGRALDSHDLIAGRYTLEVSSPGLERPLRTAEHFRAALGSEVKVKTRADFDGPRRLRGVLQEVTETDVCLRTDDGLSWRIAFEQVQSARTVFVWSSGSNNRKAKP